jgi:hypothetical protein
MDVIRGMTGPKRKRRWWTPRPHLRLVSESKAKRTAEDPFAIAMIGSFGIFVLAFVMFMGAWTGSSAR